MIPSNLGGNLQAVALHAPAAVSADADGSIAVDLAGYEGEIAVIINVADPSAGMSPTLDISIKDCATSGGSYAAVSGSGFTQITATGGVQKKAFNRHALARFIKISFDIGGTMSPSYIVSAVVVGMKKYTEANA